MSDFIPLSVPNIDGREWDYVKECLDTGWVSSVGSYVDRFEESLAAAVAADHAVAVVNGTAALHLGLLLAGVEPDDEVIVPSLTFIASANAVRYVGAWPTFLDSDPHYLQLSPSILRRFLEDECEPGPVNRRTGRRVRAVLPVHVLGHPCDIDGIRAVANEFGLTVVEDAAEALGAAHYGRPVGSESSIACFSFNGNKILTTGGGGMIVTTDDGLAERARYLSTQAKDDPLRYIHGEVGFNYRLTNVQAAIGVAQLERLDEFVESKRSIAARYAEAFRDIPEIRVPPEAPWARSNWWMYTVFLDEQQTPMRVDDFIASLDAEGIQARPLWQPMHRSSVFHHAFATDCPNAESAHRTGVSLPCSTGLTEVEQERVIDVVRRLMSG